MSSSRSRVDAVHRLMAAVPSASSPTHSLTHTSLVSECAAVELAEEAACRSRAVQQLGVAAYTGALPNTNTTPKEVNKTFLANTIRGVDSHNRREQIDDCWRKHRLFAKLVDKGEGRLGRKRGSGESCDRRREYSPSRDSSYNSSQGHNDRNSSGQRLTTSEDEDVEDERAYWARQKAKKLKTIHLNPDNEAANNVTSSSSSSLLPCEEVEQRKKKKKHKKESKKGHKKEKKSKSKKRDKSRIERAVNEQDDTDTGTNSDSC